MIDKLIFAVLVFCVIAALIAVIVWLSGRKSKAEIEKEKAEEANERNKDIARLQAARAVVDMPAIKRMLRRRRK